MLARRINISRSQTYAFISTLHIYQLLSVLCRLLLNLRFNLNLKTSFQLELLVMLPELFANQIVIEVARLSLSRSVCLSPSVTCKKLCFKCCKIVLYASANKSREEVVKKLLPLALWWHIWLGSLKCCNKPRINLNMCHIYSTRLKINRLSVFQELSASLRMHKCSARPEQQQVVPVPFLSLPLPLHSRIVCTRVDTDNVDDQRRAKAELSYY